MSIFMDFNHGMALSILLSIQQILNKKLCINQCGLEQMSLDMQKYT